MNWRVKPSALGDWMLIVPNHADDTYSVCVFNSVGMYRGCHYGFKTRAEAVKARRDWMRHHERLHAERERRRSKKAGSS